MDINKRIQSSSIAEVVIAISIIALCFGIASLVFIRSTRTTSNFQDVKKQTEIQSLIWENMLSNSTIFPDLDDVHKEVDADLLEPSILNYKYYGVDEKLIWEQPWTTDDEK